MANKLSRLQNELQYLNQGKIPTKEEFLSKIPEKNDKTKNILFLSINFIEIFNISKRMLKIQY